MNRRDVPELHYIAHLDNIHSIMEYGILSHTRASAIPHVSIANTSVQARRANRLLPSGRRLHDYANLYFHARNPMMYYLVMEGQSGLVVIRVAAAALDLDGVMIADGNAARVFGTAFWGPEDGLGRLDRDRVYAEYWTDADPTVQDEKKRVKCAEVLIPDVVPSDYIIGVYMPQYSAAMTSDLTCGGLEITIEEHMFFRGPRRLGSVQ